MKTVEVLNVLLDLQAENILLSQELESYKRKANELAQTVTDLEDLCAQNETNLIDMKDDLDNLQAERNDLKQQLEENAKKCFSSKTKKVCKKKS